MSRCQFWHAVDWPHSRNACRTFRHVLSILASILAIGRAPRDAAILSLAVQEWVGHCLSGPLSLFPAHRSSRLHEVDRSALEMPRRSQLENDRTGSSGVRGWWSERLWGWKLSWIGEGWIYFVIDVCDVHHKVNIVSKVVCHYPPEDVLGYIVSEYIGD